MTNFSQYILSIILEIWQENNIFASPKLNLKMKKGLLLSFVFAITLTACHYGKDEAQKGLERNKSYKEKKGELEAATAIDGEYLKTLPSNKDIKEGKAPVAATAADSTTTSK